MTGKCRSRLGHVLASQPHHRTECASSSARGGERGTEVGIVDPFVPDGREGTAVGDEEGDVVTADTTAPK